MGTQDLGGEEGGVWLAQMSRRSFPEVSVMLLPGPQFLFAIFHQFTE